ncbi:hypothetical protein BCR36DRAFT_291229, partial [Piromyces finnis]
NSYGTIDKEALPNAPYIWSFLLSKIENAYGAAGMIGNLYAESRLRSNDLEGIYEKSLGKTDEQYTKEVDNGTYKKFTTDSAGYGLVQWTSSKRKQGLLEYAKEQKKSIGDLQMQLDYFWIELNNNYKDVLSALKSAKSVKEASNKVVLEYEIPKDRSNSVLEKRAKFGEMLKLACN